MPVVLNVQLTAPDSVPMPDFKFISALEASSKRLPLLVIAPAKVAPVPVSRSGSTPDANSK